MTDWPADWIVTMTTAETGTPEFVPLTLTLATSPSRMTAFPSDFVCTEEAVNVPGTGETPPVMTPEHETPESEMERPSR